METSQKEEVLERRGEGDDDLIDSSVPANVSLDPDEQVLRALAEKKREEREQRDETTRTWRKIASVAKIVVVVLGGSVRR